MLLLNSVRFQTSLIGLLLVTLGGGAWYTLRLQRSHSQVLDVNVLSIVAAEELEIVVREIRYELCRFLFTGDRGHLSAAMGLQGRAEEWLNRATEFCPVEKEACLIMDVRQGLVQFFAELDEALHRPKESLSNAAIMDLFDSTLTERVLKNARLYLDHNEVELSQSNQRNKSMAECLALALLLIGGCGAIAGLIAGYGVARGISQSAFQLSVPIRDVAGKLNEVVGPIHVSADPTLKDLQAVLQTVSHEVGSVVEQLHARHREVIRADQLVAVGQLAAGLAHELRNPLMCMQTLVQSAIRRGDVSRFDFRDLSVLNEEMTRLGRLLQDFLDFARPAKPATQDFPIDAVVRQTVELVSRKAAARKVVIRCPNPRRALIVHADAMQLRQVLLNLLLNALDAVANGGEILVEVHLSGDDLVAGGECGAMDDPLRQQVVLCVADNGRGLPVEDRNRIFEPFFSTKETGLGLGLAISQRIVESHGGRLVAHDREGGGAVFEVHLPWRDGCSTGDDHGAGAAEMEPVPRARRQACRDC